LRALVPQAVLFLLHFIDLILDIFGFDHPFVVILKKGRKNFVVTGIFGYDIFYPQKFLVYQKMKGIQVLLLNAVVTRQGFELRKSTVGLPDIPVVTGQQFLVIRDQVAPEGRFTTGDKSTNIIQIMYHFIGMIHPVILGGHLLSRHESEDIGQQEKEEGSEEADPGTGCNFIKEIFYHYF
jgi:hypothetical protein